MHSCLVKTLHQLHAMRVTCKTLLGKYMPPAITATVHAFPGCLKCHLLAITLALSTAVLSVKHDASADQTLQLQSESQ